MATPIYGGFEELVYTSSAPSGTAAPFGIVTRLNPILDTSNINIRGTGKRGLYDILLGMRQPMFTMDILPTDIDFIADYQDGQTMPNYLHYVYRRELGNSADGLTFELPRFNRVSVEARHNEAITATIELWAENIIELSTMSSWPVPTSIIPYRWLDSTLKMPGLVERWWSWRYEVNNNLQRLGDVDSGATRDIKARHREVTGLIVKDLYDFSQWTALMVVAPASEEAKFNITIEVTGKTGPGAGDPVELLNNYCRWGRLEAPVGPEDLQAKRFPFTAIDLG